MLFELVIAFFVDEYGKRYFNPANDFVLAYFVLACAIMRSL